MPTCSQAKIINNLDFDIHKRVHNYVNQEAEQAATVITESTNPLRSVLVEYEPIKPYRSLSERRNTNYRPLQQRKSIAKQLNQYTADEFLFSDFRLQVNKRLPSISNELVIRKDSVPINFLYNSPLRNKSLSGGTQTIRFYRKQKSPIEDSDDNERINSAIYTDSSCSSSSETYGNKGGVEHKPQIGRKLSRKKSDLTGSVETYEKVKNYQEGIVRKPSISSSTTNYNTYYSNLPKLALEIEAIEDSILDETLNDEQDNQNSPRKQSKRFSVSGAKRLLALASIRPSKTFHKEITSEEAEILKKYYDVMKPKLPIGSTRPQTVFDNVDDYNKDENHVPILYDSAKINNDSFKSLDEFLQEHKASITSGKYTVEYNMPGFNGFVLKHKECDTVIRFPPDVHDTFVALVMTTNSKDNVNLNEAHVLRSINWNDTTGILGPKLTKTSKNKKSKDSYSSSTTTTTSSTPIISIDDIKSMSSLVGTIIEPKLLRQVLINAVDLSVLPGGINFEMPLCDGLMLENGTTQTVVANGETVEIQRNGKLKNSVYKKLKDKLNSTKVMWFSAPPTRKPMSVIFEHNDGDLNHEEVLEEANKSITGIGSVVEVEFVPRSVYFGSVYIQNQWILTLNDKDTKYYVISHGIEIKGEKIVPKSYDEFIHSEYEKYIRAEKYKQLIKNHEKAVNAQAKLMKK